jgi:PHD/YefM family antitoxin component YafN of YafNO toxin-antitoxin module
MSEKTSDDFVQTLRERGAHYVVGTEGRPVAVLLALEEYEHYLDLLDDEADSQDAELTTRLAQAATRPPDEERQSFRDYLSQRQGPHAGIPG